MKTEEVGLVPLKCVCLGNLLLKASFTLMRFQMNRRQSCCGSTVRPHWSTSFTLPGRKLFGNASSLELIWKLLCCGSVGMTENLWKRWRCPPSWTTSVWLVPTSFAGLIKSGKQHKQSHTVDCRDSLRLSLLATSENQRYKSSSPTSTRITLCHSAWVQLTTHIEVKQPTSHFFRLVSSLAISCCSGRHDDPLPC